MQALRFAEVRRSSSMIPSLIVPRPSPSRSSTAANRSSVNLTSSGPCIFGFTAYIEPVRELVRSLRPWMSTRLQSAVMIASRMPSGTSSAPSPAPTRIASVVIR